MHITIIISLGNILCMLGFETESITEKFLEEKYFFTPTKRLVLNLEKHFKNINWYTWQSKPNRRYFE